MISRINPTIKALSKVEKKAYTLLTINLLIVSFLTAFALRPSLSVVFSLLGASNEAKQKDLIITKKIEDLTQARQILLHNQNKVDLLNLAIPDNMEQDKLVKKITIIAFKRNLFLLTTDISYNKEKTTNDSTSKKLEVKLEVMGSEAGIFGFVEDLQKDERLFLIDKVLTRKTDKKTIANIYLKSFYLK